MFENSDGVIDKPRVPSLQKKCMNAIIYKHTVQCFTKEILPKCPRGGLYEELLNKLALIINHNEVENSKVERKPLDPKTTLLINSSSIDFPKDIEAKIRDVQLHSLVRAMFKLCDEDREKQRQNG